MPHNTSKGRIHILPAVVLILGLLYLFASYTPDTPYVTLVQALALAGLVFLAYRRSRRRPRE